MPHLEKFIAAARAAGATPTTLKPLTATAEKFAEIERLLSTTYATSALDSVLSDPTPGGDFDAAARTDAATAAARERLEAAWANPDYYEELAVKRWRQTHTDRLLADVGKKWAAANKEIEKIADRWGSPNPDANMLLAHATEEELAAWRGRLPHLNTIESIKKLFDEWLAPRGTFKPSVYCWLELDVTRRQSAYQPKLMFAPAVEWFLDDDGQIGSLHDARRRLNEFMANVERNKFLDACASTAPAPVFHGHYWLTANAQGVTFKANGEPTNTDVVATHDEVMDLWKPHLFADDWKSSEF